MEESTLKSQIVDRMSILKYHVSGRATHGLLDAASALEVLYREVLNLTRGWDLVAANFPRPNFPAIDLHDRSARIAVQVTVNCDTRKILKTQETWDRHQLSDDYDLLIYAGVNSVQRSKKLKTWEQVWQQDHLLNLDNLTLGELAALDQRLGESIPWHRYAQESDAHCFDVVLGVLDRSAIRHATHVEGDFDAMLDGLREIKQIIHQGQIADTALRAKPLNSYGAEYVAILDQVDDHVGRMRAIVQRHYEPQYGCLPAPHADEVDRERVLLVEAVNQFARKHGHARQIAIWEG